jgi:hypothetical protein
MAGLDEASHRSFLAVETPKFRVPLEIIDQHLGENPHFPRGIVTWRTDDIHTCYRYRIARHDRNERARGHIVMYDAVRELGDGEACRRRDRKCYSVVGLEPALRLNRDDLVAIHELPCLRSLREGLMGDEVAWRFG